MDGQVARWVGERGSVMGIGPVITEAEEFCHLYLWAGGLGAGGIAQSRAKGL